MTAQIWFDITRLARGRADAPAEQSFHSEHLY